MRLEEGKEYFICEFCRNLYFPEPDANGVRVLGERAPEACPVCAVPLVHAAIAGFRVRFCSRCRGMLIDMRAFVDLVQDLRAHREAPPELPHTFNPHDLHRHLQCPRCSLPMDAHPYGGAGNFVIDSCSTCELNWLDSGELMRVVHAPDSSPSE